jgi:ArsR family metal-binding transcriptional regulator
MAEKKYNAKAVRPCKGGGILVEGDFGRAFSMQVLCEILKEMGRCAEKLGVARIFYEECGITLYKNGRVDVHRVDSEERAIKLLDDVKVIVAKAFIDNSRNTM